MKKAGKTILIVLSRTLGFLPFAGLSLVGAFILWLRWVVNFVWYGGEAIAYSDKVARKTINDVFLKLVEMQDQTQSEDSKE